MMVEAKIVAAKVKIVEAKAAQATGSGNSATPLLSIL
jgi:hypothetical protein